MFRCIKSVALIVALSLSILISNVHSKEVKMSGPAQNGALVYSSDLNKLSEFYEKLFGMRVIRTTKDFISLDKNGFNLILHIPPFELPKDKYNPVKLFLAVENMEDARDKAIALGGKAFEGEWSNPIFKVSNIADCDGNHIQIREFPSK